MLINAEASLTGRSCDVHGSKIPGLDDCDRESPCSWQIAEWHHQFTQVLLVLQISNYQIKLFQSQHFLHLFPSSISKRWNHKRTLQPNLARKWRFNLEIFLYFTLSSFSAIDWKIWSSETRKQKQICRSIALWNDLPKSWNFDALNLKEFKQLVFQHIVSKRRESFVQF